MFFRIRYIPLALFISILNLFHSAVADVVSSDLEGVMTASVNPQVIGKNSAFELIAQCRNFLSNEFEVQFSGVPQVTAPTCDFTLGFENGIWFYSCGNADRVIIPDVPPVPVGAFVLKMNLFFKTDGGLKTASVKVDNSPIPAIEQIILTTVQTQWRGVRAFSRDLQGNPPELSAVSHQLGTIFVIQ